MDSCRRLLRWLYVSFLFGVFLLFYILYQEYNKIVSINTNFKALPITRFETISSYPLCSGEVCFQWTVVADLHHDNQFVIITDENKIAALQIK